MTLKQVIVIRKDLKMRMGKTAAQAAHASLSAVLSFKSNNKDLTNWLSSGQTKICLYVESEEELIKIYSQAIGLSLPTVLITDAGHTEFKGIPTKTCCAIGPADSNKIDIITERLKLL